MEGASVTDAMRQEEEKIRKQLEAEKAKNDEAMEAERKKVLGEGSEALDKKFKALDFLLNQSKLFSTIMLENMQKQDEADAAKTDRSMKKAQRKEDVAEKVAEDAQRRSARGGALEDDGKASTTKRGRGRPKKSGAPQTGKLTSFFSKEDVAAKAGQGTVNDAIQEAVEEDIRAGDIGIQNLKSARQPSLVTGGAMRKYQLEGLEWMISLYENGLNGILADEMGLGKTIQTISLLAFLREKEAYGPFLIAAPLSTTSNWVNEFSKWTPEIPTVLYHGSKAERAQIRAKKLKSPGTPTFPVVITSYEICMNDKKFLQNYPWSFLIIDEGHRLKNLDCKLIRDLMSYQSSNRLLITGTPLQNNLNELWSLLHFLMPEVFDKLDQFQSWFDFSDVKDKKSYNKLFSEDRQSKLVASLHAILKPFLLRRIKADVEKSLPKKREYVLFAHLTPVQKELYKAIIDRKSRAYLEDKMFQRLSVSRSSTPNSVRTSTGSLKRKLNASGLETPNKSSRTSRDSTPASSVRGSRKVGRRNYAELSDRAYFEELENSPDREDTESFNSEDEHDRVTASTLALAKKYIGQKKLDNPMMQLRLCCDSPYNFFNPFLELDDQGELIETTPDESVITSSGKMMLLDALLPSLFAGGHKVLIFSQFKTQLDILETYCSIRNWSFSRIDGDTPQAERAFQIAAFSNTSTTSAEKSDIFLLSTRAGGQGINLVAADTVVLYDSDWNPQQDLQAQDRAHRIGQTRNVIVYRLATRNTVEEELLEKAAGKRRLEKLVIREGGVRGGINNETLAELRARIDKDDGEEVEIGDGQVLTDKDVRILTDRSEEAYERAERGLDSGAAFTAVDSRTEGGLLASLKT
ncbi:hypothetical protein BT63DRAFT_402191 [Microthyrium microscopicum]|uniref:ISWI chromatin-remodeling complex ATPase ISW2 n=1 Tax=Microthyrium microscopicum TaxID=703497 RepID=A0A6A6U9N5_9PEZI|nr:hypothetical protein BT63DRAFT_402191 [Microthyrium microscopicum]